MLTNVMLMMLLQSAVSRASHDEIAADLSVRGIFLFLLQTAHRDERAAFIIRTPCGGFTFVSWPMSDDANSVTWRGAYPRGAVAIVHTHPNWLPMPSRIDMQSAVAAHLPIYVITQRHVTKTDGVTSKVVLEGEWVPTQTGRAS
jgi:proteasome lid subunit RPN8/RPN11